MFKFWFGWRRKAGEVGLERRADVPRAAMEVIGQDLDPLTGALRWERFLAMFHAEQQQGPGALLIIDLSTRFESAEASAGDEEVLPWLAQALRQAIRADDLLAHVDGYRFAILLRGAPQEVALTVSTRILASVDDTIFMTANGIVQPKVAIGGAVFENVSGRDVVQEALANFDRARRSGSAFIVQ